MSSNTMSLLFTTIVCMTLITFVLPSVSSLMPPAEPLLVMEGPDPVIYFSRNASAEVQLTLDRSSRLVVDTNFTIAGGSLKLGTGMNNILNSNRLPTTCSPADEGQIIYLPAQKSLHACNGQVWTRLLTT